MSFEPSEEFLFADPSNCLLARYTGRRDIMFSARGSADGENYLPTDHPIYRIVNVGLPHDTMGAALARAETIVARND